MAKPDEAGFEPGWGAGGVWAALAAVLTVDGVAAWVVVGVADCAFAGVFAGEVWAAAAPAEAVATGDVEIEAAVSGLCFCVPGKLGVTDCACACELALGASAWAG